MVRRVRATKDIMTKTQPSTHVAAFAGVILFWLVIISQLRFHWGNESYYNFGWFVPFLALILWLRNIDSLTVQPSANWKPQFFIALSFALLALPFHALAEVNPFWRPPLWLQGICASGFTLACVHKIYGKQGVKVTIFPLFFLITMIPWPYRIELWAVQSLTDIVVTLAMHGLHFWGYPVELSGKTLVLGTQQIGVNEACSGIRSLQALFMVTLFLGSLFGQGALRRVLAVAILPFIVIVVNAGRAIFLSVQVIVNGYDAYDAWHDPAGYIAFGISMLLIYLCIELLNVGSKSNREELLPELGKILPQWRLQPVLTPKWIFAIPPLMVFILIEGWFQFRERSMPLQHAWTLQIPAEQAEWIRPAPIHPQIEDALGFSFGKRFFATMEAPHIAEVYFYGYDRGNKLGSVSSYGHSPAICMEAVGARIIEELDALWIQVDESLAIPMQHFLFELPRGQQHLNVFWVIWENRVSNINPEDLASLDYRLQFRQLWLGRRDYSRTVLLMSVQNAQTPIEARTTAERLLSDWIVPAPADTTPSAITIHTQPD